MPKFLPTTTYRFERIGQILHARLRMNGSSLNEHLFLRNLVDSPNSLVGGGRGGGGNNFSLYSTLF